MLSTTVKVGFCRQKSKFVLFSHEILCCKTFQMTYYLLETNRISFSFSTPKLHICQFQPSFVFGFSYSAQFRFRPKFVFSPLSFLAKSETERSLHLLQTVTNLLCATIK